jgi:hypothetical protein
VTVKGKAFLFLGPKDGRLKLGASAAAAGKVANVQVGANGWTKFPLGDGAPPLATLKAWVKESHALLGAPAAKKR